MTKWTPEGSRLALPVLAAPMFLVSGPELLIAQCKAGVIGSLPALNARPLPAFDDWLVRIKEELAAHDAANPDRPAAPYAINLIVHRTNSALEDHLEICVRHKVPIVITSLGARPEVNEAIRAYGGIVLHDIISLEHAHKAVERGASGLIAVAAGAGGHAGALSPFGLIGEIREWWDGPLLLSGAMSSGRDVLAAQMIGADMAYLGTRFIPASESAAPEDYKQMILSATARDIVYTDKVSGTPANFIRASLGHAGIGGDTDTPEKNYDNADAGAKAWRDIWSAGHGVGTIHDIESTAEIVARLAAEYRTALQEAAALARLYG